MQTAAESGDLLRALEKTETSREEMKSLLRSTRGKKQALLLSQKSRFRNLGILLKLFFSCRHQGQETERKRAECDGVALHPVYQMHVFEAKLIKVTPQRK